MMNAHPNATIVRVTNNLSSSPYSNCAETIGRVQWIRGKHNMTNFMWKDSAYCGFHRFGGGNDVEEILSGKLVLLLGNSVVRRLLLAVIELMRRDRREQDIMFLPVASRSTFVEHEDALGDGHVAARYIPTANGTVVGHLCRTSVSSNSQMSAEQLVSKGCGPCSRTTSLSYAYTDTPTEGAIHSWLLAWLSAIRARAPLHCNSFVRVNVLVLQATAGERSWQHIMTVLDAIVVELKKRSSEEHTLRVFVLSRTDVSAPDGSWQDRDDPRQRPTGTVRDMFEHEEKMMAFVCTRPWLTLVPVSIGTALGIQTHFLTHPHGSAWHFSDVGRNYLAQVPRIGSEGAHSPTHGVPS